MWIFKITTASMNFSFPDIKVPGILQNNSPYYRSASVPPGQCIWYDRCGPDPDYPPSDSQHYLMCQYDGPARQVTQEMALIVQDICPHLSTKDGSLPSLCCSINQLQDMKKNFELPAGLIAQTCPTCYYNFRKNFCDLTCHPHQSEFVRVDGVVHGLGYGAYAGEICLICSMYL